MRVQAVLGLAHFTFERLQACRQLADFQLFGGSQTQLVRAAGFDQVVGCAGLDRIDRSVDGRMRSDDHHPHPRCLDAHLCQHVQAVVFTQTQVEEAQVEHLALEQGFGLRGTVGCGHAVALIFEAVAEGAQDRGLVIHKQNTALVVLG